jgi:hypothetical protein
MDRRKFLAGSVATVVIAGTSVYLLSDKHNFERSDFALDQNKKTGLEADEIKILSLASLAPSGHNTQPWFIASHHTIGSSAMIKAGGCQL